ncbi:hypothetical protein N7468_006048 [Penicillium chermesinum]|uniref:Uncharacterized protein n=1 Tax=Penicillium chermesinum TaxID=63820 RepID=A0A9W9TNT6_9EURO|nr:uncharacterized protein N7468_006048 [Penicillium chermesinum]KAJ5233092.1 hypothetical protein N7468_006048 [Penicillium chermesinum]
MEDCYGAKRAGGGYARRRSGGDLQETSCKAITDHVVTTQPGDDVQSQALISIQGSLRSNSSRNESTEQAWGVSELRILIRLS